MPNAITSGNKSVDIVFPGTGNENWALIDTWADAGKGRYMLSIAFAGNEGDLLIVRDANDNNVPIIRIAVGDESTQLYPLPVPFNMPAKKPYIDVAECSLSAGSWCIMVFA